MIEYSKIRRLQAIAAEREALERERAELCPRSSIPQGTLLEAYRSLFHRPSAYADSQVFLFCWMWLYDRDALAGRKMRRGDRKKLASMLGVNSDSSVSMRVRDLSFLYKTYPSFRAQAERLLEKAFEMHKVKES